MNELAEKVKTSIERMKAFEPPEGYLLAFSGGKDSVVLKALADMAGVKYRAHYNVTSVDPPELIYFIREKYPDVEWEYPRYDDGKRITMWNLIPRKQIPPTRLMRYCCEKLKEGTGSRRYVLTGVRWAESSRRANAHGVITMPDASGKNVPDGFERSKRGGIILNNDNDDARRVLETCYAKQKKMVNPIVDWEDSDIWKFIRAENVPYCGLSMLWSGYGPVFCNPPYGREIGKWVKKAYEEFVRGGGDNCHADSRTDGHKLFSRLHIRKSGNSVSAWASEI